jgi:SNF2 family DNA or RNA helicase
MFLQTKPNTSNQSDGESNDNIINSQMTYIGLFELPITLNLENPGEFNTNTGYKFHINDAQMILKKLDNTGGINVKLALTNATYTLFTPQRLNFISKDIKYLSKFVTISKYPHMTNRYIVQIYLYLNTNSLDELYNELITSSVISDVNQLYLKDTVLFVIVNYRSSFELNIKNITNVKYGQFELTKDFKIKPFNYQLENVNWCKNVEKIVNMEDSFTIINGIDNKIKVDYYYIFNKNILYMHGKTIVNPDMNKIVKYFCQIQGGLLCDNTGLGKTLTLTLHITEDDTNINTIITERGKMILEYKNKIIETEFEDIMIKDNILTTLDNQYKMLHNNYRLKTRCNLLVVPVRLLQQWDSEMKKYLPSVKTYVINSVRDYYKLKLDNINNYDVVIIPITFLQNDKRLVHPELYDLHDILWKRVIVDEVHEIFSPDANSKRNNIMMNKIVGLYKWGISATPTMNLDCRNILSYLSNGNYWVNEAVNLSNRYSINTNIKDLWNFMNKYYRYNEIVKVNDEIHIPDYEENIIELEMSNIEKLLYNNATGDNKRMIALCTNYKISNHDTSINGFSTVSDLKNRMLTQHNSKKKEHLEKIDAQKKTNGYIKELMDWFYTDRHIVPEHIRINYCIILGEYTSEVLYTNDLNIIQDTIEIITKKLESNEKQMVGLEKELKLIESKEKMIENFSTMIEENLNEPCMICFGNLDSVMITTCNHMYCGNCVNELFKNTQNIKCPMCRNPLTRSEVNAIVDKNLNLITADDMKKKLETKEEENINIVNGGTKIDAIIKYIKQYDGKIIIFATEKQTLDLINDILIDNKIDYVNLKGNAYVVSKQLKKFKTGVEKVILLSADRANSGTNLIEASCVILLDTHLINDFKYRKDVEKQAIGRAVRLGQTKNVKVLRFIMKNTIEQVYLNKTE